MLTFILAGAAIGAATHFLAIRKYAIPYLVVGKKREIAQGLAGVFAGKLQQGEGIQLTPEMEAVIDEGITGLMNRMKAKIPMAAMILDGPLGEDIRGIGKEEIVKTIPKLTGGGGGADLIVKQVDSISDDELMSIIRTTLGQQLRMLYLLGTVSGALVGLVCGLLSA